MTLIVALACKDGIVMASDSQATTPSSAGPIRCQMSKIEKLGNHKLWAASGSLGIIQKISDAFISLPEESIDTSLNEPKLRQLILGMVHQIRLNELNRHRLLYGNNQDDKAQMADLIITEFVEGPKIWHIDVDCRDEFLEKFGYGCSGVGDVFAHTLLKNHGIQEYCVEQGALVAYRVIKEAIKVGAYGLGEPIDIWVITKNGVKQKTQEEMMALRDGYRVWLKTEENIFKLISSPLGSEISLS